MDAPLRPAPTAPTGVRWLRRLAWAVVLGAGLAVFAWYRSPAFLQQLADRLWSCF